MVFGIISYILGDSGEAFAIQHYGMQHVEKLVHLHETFALTSLITYGFATSTQIGSMWFIKYKNYVQCDSYIDDYRICTTYYYWSFRCKYHLWKIKRSRYMKQTYFHHVEHSKVQNNLK